jgi:phosphonate transport system ATP-binding protein
VSALEIVELSKTFRGGRKALDSISLSIRPGEMVALIGASGSGKSTLLRHATGLLTADRNGETGAISILGRVVQTQGRLASDVRAVRSEVGVIFQQFNLVDRLSVLTNVLLGRLGRIPAWRGSLGLFSQAEKRSAMEALERVNMADFALQRASTLSGGQQQRVAIARALVQKASVILADEPIASLDPGSCHRVMETLSEINQKDGITVVVSLHQVDYATRYCPRTVAMRDGAIVFDGTSASLNPAFLNELYGAESEELMLGNTHHRPAAAPPPPDGVTAWAGA